MFPVLLLVLLAQGVLAQRVRRPYFCAEGDECYSFITICRDSEYETRAYEPSVWIGSVVYPNEERYRAIDRLRDYFNQKNQPGIQIEKTVPQVTRYQYLDRKPIATVVYMMLPRRFQRNPPLPTNTMVFLTQFPALTMFVKTTRSWLTSLLPHAQELLEDLLRQSEAFIADRFYIAEYSGPLTILNRHNEIWYLSSGYPLCASRYSRWS
ncbi:heme-binding protein 2-like isoform X2 [Hemiscyllium ocellatum]|nr:heme-binding protein 2-like isoform X2 [Hemiscyllium ocellatum]